MSAHGAESEVVSLDGDAAAVVHSMLENQERDPETAGLRISVEEGGCAGHSYRFALTDDPTEGDLVCEADSVSVFVDDGSRKHLEGAEITVEQTAHGTGFCIDNPNATHECGCGLSFR